MEAVLVVIFCVTAWVVGAEFRQVGPERNLASDAVTTSEQVVARESAVRICDPSDYAIIQRDLTVPVDQQANEDGQ
ncbi:MAG: hypothetical protein R3E64_18940 [Halioglobus sp.]